MANNLTLTTTTNGDPSVGIRPVSLTLTIPKEVVDDNDYSREHIREQFFYFVDIILQDECTNLPRFSDECPNCLNIGHHDKNCPPQPE